MKQLAFLLTLTLFLALACAPAEKPAEESTPAPEAEAEAPPAEELATEGIAARAVLRDAEGAEVGIATFVQEVTGVFLTAEVHYPGEGRHGFHVHEIGECVPPDFTAAGGHFNPEGTPHGCPQNPERHAGDFGNIELVGGNGLLEIPSDLLTVAPGPLSVIGKAVILHAGTDDCVGQPTGDAGSRLACGVVEPAGMEAEDADEDTEDAEGGSEGSEGGDGGA